MGRLREAKAKRGPGALVALALGLLAVGGCGDGAPRAERVVLVTIDTLRADRVGCYGDAGAYTPTLDALAASGVRFAWAIAPTPITLPSHTSLLTGLDPAQHGVRSNGLFSLADDVPTVAERMKSAGFATAAFVAAFVLDARFGLARGFDVYDDRIGHDRAGDAMLAVPERDAREVVDAALTWLAQAPPSFFLWVHLYDPHADYRLRPAFAGKVGNDPYASEIAHADAQVGRLLAAVRERFGPEGLLVAVTSDHGESLGEHGEDTHSVGIYDATQHVPLLVSGPGLPAGAVVETPVRLIDLGPTLLARAGAPPLSEARGRDLTPLVRGEEDAARPAYLETLETQITLGWSPLLGIRTEAWKYIRAPVPELYDLAADPRELVNLAEREPERVDDLDALVKEKISGTASPAATLELDDADRERLLALGYLGAGSATPEARELGVVGGANPRDHLHEIGVMRNADRLIREGRGDVALIVLRTVRFRGGHQYHQLRGLAAVESGQPGPAREAGSALVGMGFEREGLWLLGMASLLADDLAGARADLEAILEIEPGQARALVGLALVDELEGSYEAAARRYAEALASSPGHPGAVAGLAALHLRGGREKEADSLVASAREALAAEPQASLRLAAAERAAGRPGRAARILDAALHRSPRHKKLLTLRAVLHQDLEQYARAIALRRLALEQAPQDPTLQNGLAWTLALAGRDLDEALARARAAVEASPIPDHRDTLATVHLARGEAEDALRIADGTLAEASPGLRPHLLYVRAAALAELGRTEEARAALADLDREPPERAAPFDEEIASLRERLL